MWIVLVALATQFPSASMTSWMEPPAFHLKLGDARADVEGYFQKRGWPLVAENDTTLVHDYAEGKIVVLEFRDTRLTSIRFELISFGPSLDRNWNEVTRRIRDLHGEPDFTHESLLVKESESMTIHAVLENRPDSELGKQGAGRIIVRYFVPSDPTGSRETSRRSAEPS